METKKIELELPELGENKLYFYDEITTESAKDFVTSLHKLIYGLNSLDNKNNQVFKNLSLPNFNLPKTDIHIHLNTVGGYCFDGLALFDIIRTVKDRNVFIFSEGFIASMGIAVLCSVPVEFRYALENTTFMIHSVSGGTDFGKIGDLKNSLQMLEQLQKNIWNIITNNSNIPIQKLLNVEEKREDWFFTAKEALEYGLIGKII